MATTSLLTADEFFRLSDLGRPAELVRGELVMMNMPGYRHSIICGRLSGELALFLKDHDLGAVVTNDGGIITSRGPDTVRGADVAFYSYSRMPKGFEPKGYPTVVPELVFEVLSPSDAWKDLHVKVGEYLHAGVTTVCVVDPETETVIAYHADKQDANYKGDDVLTLPDILPELSLSVRRLFHA